MRRALALSAMILWPSWAHGQDRWVATWAASPAPPVLEAGEAPQRLSPSFNDETVVQSLKVSVGGERLRIRFSNEYGLRALTIGRARVGLVTADGAIRKIDVTFDGQPSVVLPAQSPMFSDPVALKVRPRDVLKLEIYFPQNTGPCGCHARGEQLADVYPGAIEAARGEPARRVNQRVFVTGVDVSAKAARTSVVVALGDSITDGYGSSVGANHRWPDWFAERIAKSGAAISVVNAGISGNHLLRKGLWAGFGDPALARFDRDVLAVSGASHLVILEGVNDIGASPDTTASMLIGAYRQLIARAHDKGLKVVIGTILPFGASAYDKPGAEDVRQAVNAWIRSTRESDGVIDFDAAVRDPANPSRMLGDLHMGDWLHPNDAGYRRMAEAVDLGLFAPGGRSRR